MKNRVKTRKDIRNMYVMILNKRMTAFCSQAKEIRHKCRKCVLLLTSCFAMSAHMQAWENKDAGVKQFGSYIISVI